MNADKWRETPTKSWSIQRTIAWKRANGYSAPTEEILEPGWAGELDAEELEYLQRKLLEDKHLAYLWGFAPSQKTRPADAIRRVAMWGDPEQRMVNYRLARPRKGSVTARGAPKMPVGRPNSDGIGRRGGTGRKTPVAGRV